MTDNIDPAKGDSASAELSVGGGAKLIVPFLIIPLIIVMASVGVFFVFGQLAQKELSALEHLENMQSTRSSHKRWQSAYALSGLLSRGDFGEDREELEDKVAELFKNAPAEESRLRKYLILSLSQVGTARSIPLLKEELEKETSDDVNDNINEDVKIFLIWSMGRIGAPSAAPTLRTYLDSEDPGFRKTAAFALGSVGSLKEDGKGLRSLLQDPIQDVGWNAALALANLGDSSGEAILLTLLDPEKLRQATPNLREGERSQITLSAVNAIGRLRLKSAISLLKNLESDGQDMALRQASRNVLTSILEAGGA